MSELGRLIRADVTRWREIYGTHLYVIHPGSVAVLLYRVAHATADRGPLGQIVSRALSLFSIVLTGADFHADATIGPGCFVPHAQAAVIGAGVRAGSNLTIYTGVVLGQGPDGGFPQVGDHVTFWTKSSAIGGVSVGDDVQVGAHALVITDIPAGHTAVGLPARAVAPKTTRFPRKMTA